MQFDPNIAHTPVHQLTTNADSTQNRSSRPDFLGIVLGWKGRIEREGKDGKETIRKFGPNMDVS